MNCLLIGVNHGYQYEGNKSVDTDAFRGLLKELQALHNADLLAEELNSEAIENTKFEAVTGSVAENISREEGISHMFCDPIEKERNILGIPTRVEIIKKFGFQHLPCLTPQQDMKVRLEEKIYWKIREQFWLEKLVDASKTNILFILGADHVNRFKELLETNGFSSKILFEHWKP